MSWDDDESIFEAHSAAVRSKLKEQSVKATKAWAIVTPRGRVVDKTTYATRDEAEMALGEPDTWSGCKVQRVQIAIVSTKQ